MSNFMLSQVTMNGQTFMSADIFVVGIIVMVLGGIAAVSLLYGLLLGRRLKAYDVFIANTQQLQRFHEWKKQRTL